ncbi:hypothetical protein [Falsiroseomonas sp.]|uniref:hypothetical protein n=1 Tax=Falsiroseomonas sp. TaxID=2870721 RepID=UPI00356A189C
MRVPNPVNGQSNLILWPEDGTSRYGAEYRPHITGTAEGGFVAIWNDFLPETAGGAPPTYP